ncbi:MAG TPA: hypothetical protein DHV85_19805 [Candidatus Accumulibacter sp.]|jgi:hypothetical protein|nr:hypothetical protein [Accumulibacter sp.]HRF12823.1 hypothetical protein [Candidatus Accumulibacter phosphatis]
MTYHRGGCHQAMGEPDRDGLGRPVARGEACASCPGCDTPHGDVGLTGKSLQSRLAVEDGKLFIRWQCPECNRTVDEETDWLSVFEDAKKVEFNPLCVHCRKVVA